MKKFLLICLMGLVMASCSHYAYFSPHRSLPIDPNLKTGTLENGLRYFLLENSKPQDRVYIRLVVNAGSLHEDDDQLGVAHIVEHMAFNGSEKFPDNQIIYALEQLGMTFARDINAFTDFENTVYTLNLSSNEEEKLLLALEVINEWMQHLTILPQDLENERGIVLAEWRSRLSPMLRLGDKKSEIEMAGSRYILRDPIGTPESIKTVSVQRVKDFYNRWYRPDNMSLVIVGDMNAAKVEKMLKRNLNKKYARSELLPTIDYSVPLVNKWRLATLSEPELNYRTIELTFSMPYQEENSIARYQQDFIHQVMANLINGRLRKWEHQYANLIDSAAFYETPLGRETIQYVFSLQLVNEEYQQAIALLFDFIGELQQNGFSQKEFDDEIKRLQQLNKRKMEVENGSLRLADKLMTASVLKQPVFMSQAQEYELNKHLLQQINKNDVYQVFTHIMALKAKLLFITQPGENKQKLSFNLNDIEKWWEEALKQKDYARNIVQSDKTLSLLQYPAGAIVSEKKLSQGDIYEFILSNGSKLVYYYSDKQPNQVFFKADTSGGMRSVPEQDFHHVRSAIRVMDDSGIGEYSLLDLANMFSDAPLMLSTTFDEYHQGFMGVSRQHLVPQLLTLFRLKLSSSTASESVLAKYKRESLEYLTNKNIERDFAQVVAKMRQPYNETVYNQQKKNIEQLTIQNIQQMYQRYITSKTDFTYFIIGDIKKDEVMALAKKYLANIEVKSQQRSYYPEHTVVPSRPFVMYGLTEPRADVEIYFMAEQQDWRAENKYLFDILADIINEKLRLVLREKEASIYANEVVIFQQPENKQIEGRIMFSASPDQVEQLIELTHTILDEMMNNGIEEKLFLKKLNEKQIQIKQSFEHLSTIIHLLEFSYRYKNNPDLVYLYQHIEQDVTLERINALATKLLNKTNRFEAILRH